MYKYLSMDGMRTLINKLTSMFINNADVTSGGAYQDGKDTVVVNVRQHDGVTSVGQYLDFYRMDDESEAEYSARLQCIGTYILGMLEVDSEFWVNGKVMPVVEGVGNIGTVAKPWGVMAANTIVASSVNRPSTDCTSNSGAADYRWANGYFDNIYSTTGGVSVTSDERLKNMDDYSDVFDELLDDFIVKQFTYKESSNGRTHLGFSAQQLEKAVLAKGLTLKDFACVTIDEAYTYEDEEGNEIEVPEIYSIRPMEMIAMLVNRVQKQKNEYKDLLGRVEKLEGDKENE